MPTSCAVGPDLIASESVADLRASDSESVSVEHWLTEGIAMARHRVDRRSGSSTATGTPARADVLVDRTAVVAGGRAPVGGEVPDGAEVVDLAGGLLAPGFVDAHVHPVQGGLERLRCDLSEQTPRGLPGHVAAYADAHPDRPWILGGGWSMAAFPGGTPTAAASTRVVPDRPVFLPNRDHHGAWVNSGRSSWPASTPRHARPRRRPHRRDADGHPTGTLHEGAMALVARLSRPPPTRS